MYITEVSPTSEYPCDGTYKSSVSGFAAVFWGRRSSCTCLCIPSRSRPTLYSAEPAREKSGMHSSALGSPTSGLPASFSTKVLIFNGVGCGDRSDIEYLPLLICFLRTQCSGWVLWVQIGVSFPTDKALNIGRSSTRNSLRISLRRRA